MAFSREVLLKRFQSQGETAIKLLDKAQRVKKTWKEEFTDFLNPDEQSVLRDICRNHDLYAGFYGGKGNFERAVAVISTEPYEGNFPVEYIKIEGNFKFEKLDHRDYLGGLLSLGIKREKIGDINVFEDGAEFLVSEEISDYICSNLTKIKHTGIKAFKILPGEARVRIENYKEMTVVASSLRLDSVVSSITGLSRAKAVNTITKGEVKVNFIAVDEASKRISEGDLLSIRGYGRYRLEGIVGVTRRERLTLLIHKFT